MLSNILAYSAVSNTGASAWEGLLAIALIAGMWMMFKKMDRPGWYSIIPCYNYYKLFEAVAGNGLLFLTMIIPIIGNFVLGYYTAKAFGKQGGTMIGLMILPSVFFPILGFGDASYYGPCGIEDQRTASAKGAKTVDFDVTRNSDENAASGTYQNGGETVVERYEEPVVETVDFDVEKTDNN